MISLDKCNGSCNSVDDSSTKMCVPSKTKDINFKAFKMIPNKNEAKTMIFHVIANANSIVQLAIQFKNGVKINVNGNVKSIVSTKVIIVGILESTFLSDKSHHFKGSCYEINFRSSTFFNNVALSLGTYRWRKRYICYHVFNRTSIIVCSNIASYGDNLVPS